jgi:hypothetical protein
MLISSQKKYWDLKPDTTSNCRAYIIFSALLTVLFVAKKTEYKNTDFSRSLQ